MVKTEMNTIRIALRVVGAAMMTLTVGVWAASSTASAGGSEQNRVEYWESQGYGTCAKHDGLTTRTFTVPPAPPGQVYTAAIVKAGSDVSVGQAHELDTSVAAGDILNHSSGKGLSFVILCTKPPPPPMTASATASASTTATGSPAAAAGGPSAAATAAASSAAAPGGGSSATTMTRAPATTTTTRPSATTRTAGGSDSTTRASAPITTTGAAATTPTPASAPTTNRVSVTTPANSASATTTNTQVSGVSTQASDPAQETEVAVAGTEAGVDDIAPTRSGLPLGLALVATFGLLLGGAALLLLPGRLTAHRGRHRQH